MKTKLFTLLLAIAASVGLVNAELLQLNEDSITCLPETPEELGLIRFDEPNILGCWSVGVMNGTTKAPYTAGSKTGKFGYYLYIFNTAASDGAYAIMPPLDVEDINKYQVSFDVLSNSTTATNVKRITVGIISNAADLSTFAPLTVVHAPYATDSTGAMRVTIPFDSYKGDLVTGDKGTQVMFLSESGDSTNYIQIDNLSFEQIPGCAAPAYVQADSVGTYGAKISWNKTGAAYDLAITSSKKAPNEEGAVVVKKLENIKDTFAVVDGLEMLTQYFMFVRTICGEGDTSAWSHARSFTTICPDAYALPFAEDFESYTTTTGNRKPDCWTCYYLNGTTVTEGTGASYPSLGTTASYAHASTRYIYMYSSGATTKTYSFAALPYIENDLTKAMVSFWYRANAYAAATPTRKLVVGIADEVSTLDTLMATLSVLDTIVQTNTSSTIPYEKYSRIISEKYNGKGHYIVLIGIDGNGATSIGGMYVDDIEVSLVPTCFLPDNLSAEKMYDTSAQLSWTQLHGDNKEWDVAYGLKDAAIESMTIVKADTNVFVVNGLQPSTEYDFYVRANCGDGDLSEWRGPVTATTLYQIPLADAKWTFENGEPQKAQAPTGSYKIPQAWMVNNVWTGLATVGNAPYINYNTKNATTGLVTARRAYSGDSVMYFYSNTTAHPGYGPYAVLPVINDADYDSLQVRFMARVTYSGTPSKVDGRDSMMYTTYAYAGGLYKRTIYVGVATDPYDMNTFEEMTAYVLPTLGTSTTSVDINKVPDPEGTNYWREVVVPLYGAKGKYIILAGPGDYNTVYVDDVTIEKVDPNACANVTKLALNEETLKYNTAEFSWLSPKTSFKVTITEKDSVEAYATAIVNAASFKIDTLQAQTTYTISVQAVCGDDLSKAVELTFKTPCKPAEKEEASWNFADNLVQWGTSATYVIPECWDEGLGYGSSASNTPYAVVNTTTYAYARVDAVTDRALRFYTTASYYNAYAVLPELGFELDSMTLHFWGRAAYFYSANYSSAASKSKLYTANQNYARALVVGTITDVADFSTFTPIDTITYDQKWTSNAGVFAYNDPLGNDYWQEYALPLAKYQGKGRIAIVAPQPSAASYFFIDDLEIVKEDHCFPITSARVVDVDSTSATIRWNQFVQTPHVQLRVATNELFEESSIVYNQQIDSANMVELNGLQPITTYYFQLKHLCDIVAGDESEWTVPYSFTTNYIYSCTTYCDPAQGSIHSTSPAQYMTLTAIPNDGYHFVQWQDGNTDNPRTVELTQDTTFIAEFASNECIIASGYCGAEGDSTNLTWKLSCDSVLTISGTGNMANYSYNVPWLNYRQGINTIILEEGVTSIGEGAFWACEGLTSITIPNSVTSIENYAFQACSGLTSVTIPNSVTSIGEYAFWYCSGLTSITIPNSVTSIESAAFMGCSGLTSIVVEEGNTKYDSRDNCNAIIETATNTLIAGCQSTVIPNSVTSIGNSAFRACSGLTSVTIPNSVTSIESAAFAACSGLTSIEIPNSVTSIGSYAFDACSDLTSITIPNSVISIGDLAFQTCSGLTSVTIPNSVTRIGWYAFYGCTSLTSIEIPNSVTDIGEGAFSGCSGLTSIVVEEGNAKYDSRENCNAIIETASNTLISGCQTTLIPNSVISIGNGAFLACSGLTSVTIPNSVTSIESRAFRKCSGLTSITNYATTPQNIGSDVFSFVNKSNCTIYVPAESIELYRTAEGWSEFTNIKSLSDYYNPEDPQNPGQYRLTLTAEPAEMGTVTGSGLYAQGTEVEFSATPNAGCRFVGWSDGVTETTRSIVLNRDTAFTASFIYDTLTVTGNKDIAELRVAQEYPVAPSTHLFVKADAHLTVSKPTSIYALTLYADSSVAQISGIENLTTEIAEFVWMLPDNVNSNKWLTFAVPFDVAVSSGIRKEEINMPAINGYDFVIDEYDGALRASVQNGWQRVAATDTLRPGRLYMINSGNAPKAWRFTAAHPEALTEQTKLSVAGYPSSFGDHHSGWNGIANPLWTNGTASMDGLLYATTYNNFYGAYEVQLLNDYRLRAAEPFFVQAPADGSILFSKNASQPNNAPSRKERAEENTNIYTVGLTASHSNYTDKAYITLNETKEDKYIVGYDLEKMQGKSASVPQLWMEAYNMRLAAHEVMFSDSTAYVPVGIYAPTAGAYVLQISDVPEATEIHLMRGNKEIWNLSESAIELELTEGNNNDYSLYIHKSPKVITSLQDAEGINANAYKVMINGQIYILRGDKTYTITGTEIK